MDVKHIIRTFYISLKIPLLAFDSEFHASGSSKNQSKLLGKGFRKKVLELKKSGLFCLVD